ncbi:MAG: hypothetical protein CMH53_10130, partial [Myxococcales bacterium]|nr:hypothetical protein [Myxococcales bacterium]
NDNRICVAVGDGDSVENLNLSVNFPKDEGGNFQKLDEWYRPPAPFKPYDCKEMKGGPIPVIKLPDNQP